MASVFVERRQLSKDVALTWDMAHHLYTRYNSGPVFIIAVNPVVLLAALRKQWLRVIAKMRKERSSTVDEARKRLLNKMIVAMEGLPFTTMTPTIGVKGRGVYIMEPSALSEIHAKATTIYITYECPVEDLPTDMVVRYGAIVEYAAKSDADE